MKAGVIRKLAESHPQAALDAAADALAEGEATFAIQGSGIGDATE